MSETNPFTPDHLSHVTSNVDFSRVTGFVNAFLWCVAILAGFQIINVLTVAIQGWFCKGEECYNNTRDAVYWLTLIALISAIIPFVYGLVSYHSFMLLVQ